MSQVEATVSAAARDPNRRRANASRTNAADQTEQGAGAGTKALYGLLGIIVFGYAISLVVPANGASTTLIDGWGVAAFELLVSVLVLIRAAVSPRDRRFCLALGAGMCLWAIGDFAMTYERIHNANPPTPVLANYLWAAFFPVAYMGVMLLMRQEVRKFTTANYLDGVVVTLTCAAAFAAFAFGPVQHWVGDDSVTVAWNLIYPVGDILLLILTLIAAAMLLPGRRLRWYLMAAASLANAIGTCARCSTMASGARTSATSGTHWPGRSRCSFSRCRSGCAPTAPPNPSSRRPARTSRSRAWPRRSRC